MDVYERSARAYDLMGAAARDYPAEADELARLVKRRCPDAASLLDVACGTGSHLSNLRRHFTEVAGVDLSSRMLERAQRELPDVRLERGDMRSFGLQRRFDVVTCLASSIGYLLTIDDVHAAVANMADHVSAGGLLIVEPWIHPDQWRPGSRVADSANGDGMAVGRVSVSGLEGHVSTFDLHWTIASDDGVEQFVEPHRMGLYSIDQYLAAFETAGMAVEHHRSPQLFGRGLFIGQR